MTECAVTPDVQKGGGKSYEKTNTEEKSLHILTVLVLNSECEGHNPSSPPKDKHYLMFKI